MWGLPYCTQVSEEEQAEPEQRKTKLRRIHLHRLDNLPQQHSQDRFQITWHRPSRCFAFIVDCKPLAEIMNGAVPLHWDNDLEPCIERMTDNIFSLLRMGWTTSNEHTDPITWRRREHNKIADHLVNYTMDSGSTWAQIIDPPEDGLLVKDLVYVCHSDGGTRGDTCSAAGWIIEAGQIRNGRCKFFPVGMGGTFLQPAVSAFKAECIALDNVIRALLRLVVSAES